jgi:hypothetical protein
LSGAHAVERFQPKGRDSQPSRQCSMYVEFTFLL